MTAFLEVNGNRATRLTLLVPESGVWLADVEFDTDVALAGAVTVRVGEGLLRGTVDPLGSGTFQLKTRVRVLGGAGGWRKRLTSKHYHNDAGVKLSTILQGAADETGETIAGAPTTRIGADFVRAAGPASRLLERLQPGAWRVDYDGVTRFGARAQIDTTSPFDMLDYDPRTKVATLAVDELGAVVVGSVLRDRLERPLTVRALELVVGADKVRAQVWGRELAA